MPFQADEIVVGMMAWFTVAELRRHPRVRATGLPTDDRKPRPFVCYAQGVGADGEEEWYWTNLTGTWKPNRRTIARRWLRVPPGCTAFLSMPGDLIVGDPGNGYVGPGEAFA